MGGTISMAPSLVKAVKKTKSPSCSENRRGLAEQD